MKELQRKQKIKRIIYSPPSICILVLLTFLLGKGAIGVMMKERESAQKVANLEAQSEELRIREAQLQADIARLQTEDGVIEAIKEKFSVTQEGEYVAIIVDERDREATTTPSGKLGQFRDWWANLWE